MKREQETFPYIAHLLNGAEVEWKPLGEVCEFSNTGVDKKTIEGEKKVKLLNFVDVFHKQYITKETPTMIVSASDKKILDCNILKGDVFITPSSEILDEIGYSATAIEDIEGAVYSYHIMRLRIYDKEVLHPEYLAYLFSSDTVRKQIRIKAQGITRFGLTLPRWKSIQIPIPPLSVQQEIVRILDKFTQLEAELKAELETELKCRKQQYEYYRDKLLTSDEKQVEWKKLGEVMDVYTGGEAPKNLIRGEKPEGNFIYPIYSNGEEIYGFTDSYRIEKDAVTISSIGAKTGTIYFRKAYFTPIIRLKVLVPKNKQILNSRYVFHYLSNIPIITKKSSVPNINANEVKRIQIPIPPIEEQERIAGILDKFDTLVNSISEGLPREIELRRKQYEYYREKLLSFPTEEK